ncbi:hypothetical protein M422DRAFT_248893 [Sphaerobolus stellatus SS14]|nr:hypothetical protein M422DRAFT_248893 [Sphaerobolus stellatus SS14]
MPPDRISAEPKCKPRIWKPPVAIKERHENLTAYDWLQVMFRSHLRVTAMQTVKQTTLDRFVSRAGYA